MKKISKEIIFVVAIIIDAIAVNMMIASDFGISTISSFPYVLSNIFTKVSFGMMNFIVQSFTLVVLMIITRKPSPYYVLSFIVGFIFGSFVDLFEPYIAQLHGGLVQNIFVFLFGWVLMCVSVALFNISELPVMPFDTIVKDLTAFTKCKYRKVKTIIDVTFLSLAILLSLIVLKGLVGIGVGTIFMTFFTGTFEGKILGYLKKNYTFFCETNVGKKLESLKAIK